MLPVPPRGLRLTSMPRVGRTHRLGLDGLPAMQSHLLEISAAPQAVHIMRTSTRGSQRPKNLSIPAHTSPRP